MSSLFELSAEANRLEELLLQSEGELTPFNVHDVKIATRKKYKYE